jgi:Probable zinc-ribbon domain
MGAGLYNGEPTGDPAGVPCDPESWSEESKRSVAYLFRPPRPYRDKAYQCWRCGARDVFTAVEQKHAFEVRKVNISQQRILCLVCHSEWVRLEREASECRRRWATERHTLLCDSDFLDRWLEVLESLPDYNGARDEANIVMLHRLTQLPS